MRTYRAAAALTACLAHAACLSVPGHDRDAPFDVSSVDPPGGAIARGQVFRVSFTRPLDLDSVPECAVALAPASSLDDEVAAAFAKAEVPSAVAAVVECGTVGAGGSDTVLSFAPARTLRPGASYRLVVSGAVRDSHGFKLGDALGGPYVGPDDYVVPGGSRAAALVISEVMANPRGDEARSEYVELHNPSDTPVDMEFFSLAFRDGPVQEVRACGQTTVIPAGGFGLVGGEDFAAPIQGPAAPAGCAKGRLGGRGVVNYAGQVVDLADPTGRVVSTYTGWLASKAEGRSLERIDLGGPDDPANWGFSTAPGGTPGAPNSLSSAGPASTTPRLLKFDPSGSKVDPASRFGFLFSSPVACLRAGGCVAVREDTGACATGDTGRVEGSEEYSGRRDLVQFSPLSPLRAEAGYFIGIAGLAAFDGTEADSYCLPVRTGGLRDSDPPRVRLAFPPDGGVGIPPNVRAIHLEFDEPVDLGAGAVWLLGGGAETAMACGIPGAGRFAECRPEPALRPGIGYRVDLRGPARDPAGNVAAGLPLGQFFTGTEDDLEAPEFRAEIISASPKGLAMTWRSSEQCRASYVAAQTESGDGAFEGTEPGFADGGLTGVVLSLGTASFELEIFCADPSGNSSQSAFFWAGPESLPPPVAITEVMANPAGAAGAGGFVEIANYGDTPVDTAGWSLLRCGENEKASAIPASGRTMLAPGDRVLLVGENDTGSFPWGARTVEMQAGILPGGISRTAPERICLQDAAGAPVSSYGGWMAPPKGFSIERVADDAADAPAAWARSAGEGGTPTSPRPTARDK
ncbi:MAG: lamin tail domain-containing protein [Deltaproteobacteria bacterium]|nr:lamin tail domain-containing protein [Deltaproteobacteria bacterium]